MNFKDVIYDSKRVRPHSSSINSRYVAPALKIKGSRVIKDNQTYQKDNIIHEQEWIIRQRDKLNSTDFNWAQRHMEKQKHFNTINLK